LNVAQGTTLTRVDMTEVPGCVEDGRVGKTTTAEMSTGERVEPNE
jgi:hypothetical protein